MVTACSVCEPEAVIRALITPERATIVPFCPLAAVAAIESTNFSTRQQSWALFYLQAGAERDISPVFRSG